MGAPRDGAQICRPAPGIGLAALAGARGPPTEEEWTYAARGGGEHVWIWGADHRVEIGDRWDRAILKHLKLERGDRILEDVGVTGSVAEGPFGHGYLVAQVWEWTATRHGPLAGADAFQAEFERFRSDRRYWQLPADKAAEHLQHVPYWEEDKFVIKGGAYAYGDSPVQFHIDARHRLPSTETTSVVGFRMAKSLEPGRDGALSRILLDHDRSVLGGKRTPNIKDQVGIERHDVDSDGRTAGYHTVSFVPVSHIFDGRPPGVKEAIDNLRIRPELLGTLLTTKKLGSLDPGLYSVHSRPAGMPAELDSAMREPGSWPSPPLRAGATRRRLPVRVHGGP